MAAPLASAPVATASWPALAFGDTIDVVAPGWKTTRVDLQRDLKALRTWGFQPRVAKAIFGRDYLCANSREERLAQLVAALKARDSKAVWCVRGGYGAIHLLPGLARLKPPKNQPPKPLLGLSDVTSLHLYLNQSWQWPTLHAPLLDRLGKGLVKDVHLRELEDVLLGRVPHIAFERLKPLNSAAERPRRVHGVVTGGNLMVVGSTLGTAHTVQSKGRILFFEEVGERAYRIDRVLEQMTQAGVFQAAKAVVFGDFYLCQEPDGKALYRRTLKDFAARQKIPVLSGLPSGHAKIQRPLPFHTPSVLELGARSRLVCSTGCR